MKRVLCLLLLALTVPVLLIPASAAEEYVFEWVNPEVMLLGDAFSFGAFEDMFLMFDGLLPEGTYRVDFYNDSAEFDLSCFLSEAVCLEYSDYDGQLGCFISCVISFQSDAESFVLPLSMFVVVDEADNMTGVQFYNPETSQVIDLAAEFDYMVFTPVATMDVIMNGFASLNTTTDSIFQLITENALLASFAAAGLIIVCVPIFIALKKSAR